MKGVIYHQPFINRRSEESEYEHGPEVIYVEINHQWFMRRKGEMIDYHQWDNNQSHPAPPDE